MLEQGRARLLAIVLLALVLRTAVVFLPFEFSASDTPSYDFPARSLSSFRGYLDENGKPTAERPPGYPAFLALVYVVSTSPRAVGLAQALLGAATVALVHRLVAKRKPTAAEPAALLLAVDPVALGVVPYVLREAWLLFLLTLLLVLLEELKERPRALGLGAGAVLALLALTHQLYVLLVGFLIVSWLIAKRRVVPLVIAAGVVALGVGAWTARNAAVGSGGQVMTSYPVPAGELWIMTESTNEWLHDDPTTAFQEFHFQEVARLFREHGGDTAAVKSELYARAWANFEREPLVVLGRAARINLWYWLEIPGSVKITIHPRLRWLRLGLIPFHWLRLLWAVAGVVELRRRRELGTFASELAAWAFLAIGPALLIPLPRYLSPLVGVLDALAAIGAVLYRERQGGASA